MKPRVLFVSRTRYRLAYVDLRAFLERPPVPLPDARRVVFVGALERYKGVYVLAEAWRDVARQLPFATAVGGVPDIAQDGVSGILVPPENPRALEDALAA